MTIDASRDPAPRVTGEELDGRGEVTAIGLRLVEEAYLAWTTAACESEWALRAWLDAGVARREDAYAVYRAALDREEAAARDLQRLSELVAMPAASAA